MLRHEAKQFGTREARSTDDPDLQHRRMTIHKFA
jgi:hypothetical protein